MSEETRPADRPATFRDVFGQSEYRALYAATTLSWLGDYIARAAITVIVFDRTNSVGWSAAAFAVSYLPWLVGGPLLATLAERYPYRRVMIVCDLIRMPLIALVAVPRMPVWAMLVLLFLTTLANPPAQAARSALMPVILPGDRVVLGLSINQSTGQAAQVVGYAAGAGIAAFQPQTALLLDAATFLASALIIWFWIKVRPPAYTPPKRSRLVGEMVDGFRVVFGDSVRRPVAIIVFSAVLFAIVPEGLAAGWVEEETGTASNGLYLALIMASGPLGVILGGLTLARLFAPLTRQRLVRPFAVLSPLALVPALLNPHPYVVAVLAMISGFAVAGLLPVANGLFVQALPSGYRARAFGVMNTGVQLAQGGAVLVTGLVAERSSIPRVVGLWSVAGVLLMLVVSAYWPSPSRFAAAITHAARHPGTAPTPGAAPTPGTAAAQGDAATQGDTTTPDDPTTPDDEARPDPEGTSPPRPEAARARSETAPQQRGAGGERGGPRPAHVRP